MPRVPVFHGESLQLHVMAARTTPAAEVYDNTAKTYLCFEGMRYVELPDVMHVRNGHTIQ